jgi:hypothetical protein
MAARGRLGLLVETHSWRSYAERVRSTYHTLQAVFELARTAAVGWRTLADAVDRQNLAGTKVTLMWKTTEQHREIEFRSYAYELRPSEVSGGTWIVYDETKPETWKVPLYDQLVPAVTVDVPRAGFIVDGGFATQVGRILHAHGINHYPAFFGAVATRYPVEAYRATKVTYQPPFEGRTRVSLEGAWHAEQRMLDQGAIFIPIDQPLARVILHLLDPALPDSLVQWGVFNACFEQKEYMESYVAEEQARMMLEHDSTLRAQFDAAVAADPELAKSPAKRLTWFYQHHPAWDDRVNLYPVYRVATRPDARPPH